MELHASGKWGGSTSETKDGTCDEAAEGRVVCVVLFAEVRGGRFEEFVGAAHGRYVTQSRLLVNVVFKKY